MVATWLLVLVAAVAAAALASRQAVGHALDIAERLGVSKGLIGVTLVALGTDLPEIANSISASLAGHGDVNVGDSTGSALTQVTLVLAVLLLAMPAFGARSHEGDRSLVLPVGITTVLAILVIALLILDERLERSNGIVLVAIWVVAMVVLGRQHGAPTVAATVTHPRIARDLAALMAWLAVVAVAAVFVVRSFVELTEAFGVPELLASTIVLALGTSTPELFVDLTAIRRGAATLAVGDLFGSSLIDSTVSIGIGPIVRPTAVSAAAAPSVLVVGAGVAAATWLVGCSGHVGRRLAAELIVVYLGCAAALVLTSA